MQRFSTFFDPMPEDFGYNAVSIYSLPGKPIGLLLPNTKGNWMENVIESSFNNAVYWSNPGIVGLRTSSKTVVQPGTLISVRESGTSNIIVGVVNDIILPATTVNGLCMCFSNDELGVSMYDNPVDVISQSLGIDPTDKCVGYVIDFAIGKFGNYISQFCDRINKIDKIPQHGCYV